MSGSLSLDRGLSVLEVLKSSGEPLGVREIARRLELSAPAVQRILNTLAEHEYVDQNVETRRYGLGYGLLVLAQHLLKKDRLIELADPELQELAADGCFNAFLGMRRRSAGMYLLAVQSSSPVVIRSTPGEPMRLHSTALGKALLLGLPDQALRAFLAEVPLEKLTPRTVTEPERLIAQLQAARAVGYTTSLDENILGVISIGAPVWDADHNVVAAISVAYPRSVGPQIAIAELGERVAAAAARISAGLGSGANGGSGKKGPHHAA